MPAEGELMQTDCRITITELSKDNETEYFTFTLRGNKDEITDFYISLCEKKEQISLKTSLDQKLKIDPPYDKDTNLKTAEMVISVEVRKDLLKEIEIAAENVMIKKINMNYLLSYIKEAKANKEKELKATEEKNTKN